MNFHVEPRSESDSSPSLRPSPRAKVMNLKTLKRRRTFRTRLKKARELLPCLRFRRRLGLLGRRRLRTRALRSSRPRRYLYGRPNLRVGPHLYMNKMRPTTPVSRRSRKGNERRRRNRFSQAREFNRPSQWRSLQQRKPRSCRQSRPRR